MTNINLYLKSGHVIKIVCNSITMTRNAEGEYTGYEIKGLKSPKAFGVALSQIAGWEEMK
jgi:hypothetical protein